MSNSVSGLQVQSLPKLPSAPGSLTVAYLVAERDFLADTLEAAVKGSLFDTPQLDTALANELSALDTIIPGVERVFFNLSQTYTIGSFAGQNVTITTSDLSRTDQVLLAVLGAQAGATFSTSSQARSLLFQRFGQAAGSSGSPLWQVAASTTNDPPACQAAEASTAFNDYSSNTTPDPKDLTNYFSAIRTSVACAAPQAINTGLNVVLGGGAVALGVLALITDVPVAAVALPTAALVYITLGMAGGEISVGGALGQTSAAAVQLVQNGLNQINSFLETLLAKAAILSKLGVDNAETFAALTSLIYGLQAVWTSFTSGPPFNGGGPPSQSFALFVSTTGMGKGTITSYPGLIQCGNGASFCTASFRAGSTVFLSGRAAPGSAFSSWSGTCPGGACTMNSNQNATAEFKAVAQVFSGSFHAAAELDNTLNNCRFTDTISSSITLQLIVSNGQVGGTAQLTGNWSSVVIGGTSCIPTSGNVDATTSVSGTPNNITLSTTFPDSACPCGSFTVQFHGVLGTAVTGTMTFTQGNTTGSISEQITLNPQP